MTLMTAMNAGRVSGCPEARRTLGSPSVNDDQGLDGDEHLGIDFDAAGFIPPDPDEPPPVELWRLTGGVLPWGTLLVLLAWGVSFALLAARGEIGDTAALVAHGANLPRPDALDVAWRLLASTFLHAGPSHVFFNALTLLVFGPSVERLFTRWGFPIIHATGGALASLASLSWRLSRHGADAVPSIGGSGAVFALGGAVLAAAFRLRARLAPGRARALAAVILFLSLPALAAGFERLGTDNAAHAAGLVAGLALGAIVPLAERVGGSPPGPLTRVAGTLAVAALVASFVGVLIAR
jgi:membrane associated rhomboid family serine protease